MSIARGQPIEAADIDAFFEACNDHFTVPENESAFGASGNLLTELNRVRTAMELEMSALPQSVIDAGYGIVGGPWAVSRQKQIWGNCNVNHPFYCYADDGSSVTVTANTAAPHGLWNEYTSSADQYAMLSEVEHFITIGGDSDGTLSTSDLWWTITAEPIYQGHPWPPTFTATTDLPGAGTITATKSGSRGYRLELSAITNASCSPGTYSIRISVTSANKIQGYGQPTSSAWSAVGQGWAVFSVANTSKETVPGISDPNPVSKIVAPYGGTWGAFGIWHQSYGADANGNVIPVYYPIYHWWEVSADIRGLWFARTAPIHAQPFAPLDDLPPNTPYRDSPGGRPSDNIDPVQYLAAPATATDVVAVTDPGLTYSAPRWPIAASSETPYSISTITSDRMATAPATGFLALGYTIEDVLIRRAPVLINGIHQMPTSKPEVTIELGCWRSGVFVSWYTATIAEGADETRFFPQWPVFNGAPLVYNSTHPVQIHATPYKTCDAWEDHTETPPYLSITYLALVWSWGEDAVTPIAAAQLNDILAYIEAVT